MKLSLFITAHLDAILLEWDSFARTQLPAATGMSAQALRDHARQILTALAKDIETDQSPKEQYEKSKGMGPEADGAESAASTHGTLRHVNGFTLPQLIAEFRALRATVLRLWIPHITQVTEETSNDMVRFNETIDQALAESAVTYSEQAARTRDTFLAILGHDLRSPLAAMSMAGELLTRPESGTDSTRQIGVRVKRSAATMSTMVNDLLEYARMQLGSEMPMTPQPADLADTFQAALHDSQAAHPDCEFGLETKGDLRATFDSVRLQQVITNLLTNAAQYRSRKHPVTISIEGEPEEIKLRVKNFGPVIPADSLRSIFDPMVQLATEKNQPGRPATSLGLGLFIAREITLAHGGTISAESGERTGTVFTVALPRTPAAR
jgi:signal transduction histidine kinase